MIPIEPENILWKGQAAQARLELAKTLFAIKRGSEPWRGAGRMHARAQVRARDPAGSCAIFKRLPRASRSDSRCSG